MIHEIEYEACVKSLKDLREKAKYEEMYELAKFYYSYYFDRHEFVNELGLCLYHLGNYDASWNVYQRILHDVPLKSIYADLYKRNLCLLFHKLSRNIPDPDISLCENKPLGLITFAITTCKGLNVFIRTMNAFLYHCRDVHLISRWICVDEGSTESERAEMRTRFPFFEFVWKSDSEKGRAKSMNMVLQRVNTLYMFHMEDGWEFIAPNSYMKDCVEVIQQNPRYGQCLVNQNYAETMDDMDIAGGIVKSASTGRRYREHEYREELMETDFLQRTHVLWPHYSLRPGLTRTRVLREVGVFVEDGIHFELEYAKRYHVMGYMTVFLDNIHTIRMEDKLYEEKIKVIGRTNYTVSIF